MFLKIRRVRGNSLTKRSEKHSFDMNMNEFPSLGDSASTERVVNISYGPGQFAFLEPAHPLPELNFHLSPSVLDHASVT